MRHYTGYSYVKKLERCLRKMPYEERLDAVNYYTEYLADAGPDREQEVIERLGPPQHLAAEIRADAALRELNAKTEFAERAKAEKRWKKYASQNSRGDNTPLAVSPLNRDEADFGAAETIGGSENAKSPNMGESFSAAGLGAISMLSMPVSRPLAVFACVLGIIGLILGIIIVVAIYAAAGALVVCGTAISVMSFAIFPQDPAVSLFIAGGGIAFLGIGIVIVGLNSLLGSAIFKGIANLAGRIRHKRVRVRKETFNYAYAGYNPRYTEVRPDAAGAHGAGESHTEERPGFTSVTYGSGESHTEERPGFTSVTYGRDACSGPYPSEQDVDYTYTDEQNRGE